MYSSVHNYWVYCKATNKNVFFFKDYCVGVVGVCGGGARTDWPGPTSHCFKPRPQLQSQLSIGLTDKFCGTKVRRRHHTWPGRRRPGPHPARARPGGIQPCSAASPHHFRSECKLVKYPRGTSECIVFKATI